jgi:hypothetical protein
MARTWDRAGVASPGLARRGDPALTEVPFRINGMVWASGDFLAADAVA